MNYQTNREWTALFYLHNLLHQISDSIHINHSFDIYIDKNFYYKFYVHNLNISTSLACKLNRVIICHKRTVIDRFISYTSKN